MLKIYVDRLKDGNQERIDEVATPEFLDIHEKDLTFPDPVSITGGAYLADQHIVLNLKIKTTAIIPCAVCNGPVKTPVIISDFSHTEDIEELRSPIYEYTECLREAILLQIPAFTECNGGSCPERESIKEFLKKPERTAQESSKIVSYFPFADLDK